MDYFGQFTSEQFPEDIAEVSSLSLCHEHCLCAIHLACIVQMSISDVCTNTLSADS